MRSAVLLVDDDDHLDMPLRDALQRVAPEVMLLTARSGKDAIQALEEAASCQVVDVAVVLLDLVMPRTPGLEVLMNLRALAETRSIPVVVVTRSRQEVDRWLSYKLGANAYIAKPADPSETEWLGQICDFWCNLNVRSPIYFKEKQTGSRLLSSATGLETSDD